MLKIVLVALIGFGLTSCGPDLSSPKKDELGLVSDTVSQDLWGIWQIKKGQQLFTSLPVSFETGGKVNSYLNLSEGLLEVITVCTPSSLALRETISRASSPSNYDQSKIEILKYQRTALSASQGPDCVAEVAQATLKYKFTEEEGILEVFRDDRKLVLEKLKAGKAKSLQEGERI